MILKRIKDRYYREVIGGKMVTHFGDCRIYSAEAFCSCGLLHELDYINLFLADAIYPNYNEDILIQEKITETFYGSGIEPTWEGDEKEYEDLKKRYQQDKKLLLDIFGECDIVERLEEVYNKYVRSCWPNRTI